MKGPTGPRALGRPNQITAAKNTITAATNPITAPKNQITAAKKQITAAKNRITAAKNTITAAIILLQELPSAIISYRSSLPMSSCY